MDTNWKCREGRRACAWRFASRMIQSLRQQRTFSVQIYLRPSPLKKESIRMSQAIRSCVIIRRRRLIQAASMVASLAISAFILPTVVMGQAPATTGPATEAKPVIQALAPLQDFGTVTEGTKLRHSFRLPTPAKPL